MNTNAKILVVASNRIDSTSFYRAWGVMPYLTKLDPSIQIMDVKDNMNWVEINQADIIYLQRPFTMKLYQMAAYAKQMGKKLWLDYDDDLMNLPQWHISYDLYMSQEVQQAIIKFLQLADVVTVSTQWLYGSLLKHNENIVVIPNALNDYMTAEPLFQEPAKEMKVIAWRGSETHFMDLTTYSEAIEHLDKDRKLTWVYMGMKPWWLRSKFTHVPVQDPIMYFKSLMALNPSVMFVPLVDDRFNKAKSNINFIEATMAGAVTLAPNWQEWNLPGVITYDDPTDFYPKFVKILDGDYDLKNLHSDAMHYITNNLLLSSINQQRVDIITDLLCS